MLTTLLVLIVTAGLLYGAYWASITLGQKALEKQELERSQASEARKLKRLAQSKRGVGVAADDDAAGDDAAGPESTADDDYDDPDSPVGRLTITAADDDGSEIPLAGPSPRRPSPPPPRRAPSPDDSGPIPLE